MLLLRVVAVDLLPRFADLLDDDVGGRAFDDGFDCLHFVPWNYYEPVPLSNDTFIVAWRYVDRGNAGGTRTFAVKRQRAFHSVLRRALLDSFVDPAKDLFVSSGATGEVHLPAFSSTAVEVAARSARLRAAI